MENAKVTCGRWTLKLVFFVEIPQELQGIVSNLKQIASDILAREAAAAEERIRLFTEQQTIALDTLRERALREHKSLIKYYTNSFLSMEEVVLFG